MNPHPPITEEDQRKSYYKYYLRDMTAPAPEAYEKAAAARLTPEEVLSPHEVDRLLEAGPIPGEMGYCALPDGTAYMANRMFLPGVTPEMFDWWFAWHGLDTLRYKIWDKEDHLYAQTRNVEQTTDPNLSWRERIWHTRHDITEAFGPVPKDVVVPFIPPWEMGFDREKLEQFPGTVVAMAAEDVRTTSCHVVRAVEGGSELRSRFWFGWCLKDGKIVRFDEPPLPEQVPKGLLLHNIKEFTNLASFLPEIFAEERDNF